MPFGMCYFLTGKYDQIWIGKIKQFAIWIGKKSGKIRTGACSGITKVAARRVAPDNNWGPWGLQRKGGFTWFHFFFEGSLVKLVNFRFHV
jgi:hypothetical protein